MKINTHLLNLFYIVIFIGITFLILNNANEKIIPLISAMIGAGFALFGVWLNNAWSDKRSLKERKNAILLASLDRRLTAHQEAYNFLRKLLKAAYSDWDSGARRTNLIPIIDDAHDFWDKNTLFLSEDASNLFQLFIFRVVVYNKENVSSLEEETVEKYLINAGRAIKQGVEIYIPDQILLEELKRPEH